MTQTLKTIPLSMTYEEFLEWANEDTNAEWVDGKAVFMSPVSNKHQDVGLFLLRILADFVERGQLGIIRYERYQMKTGPGLPGREPDILFVANKNLSRVRQNHLEGPADLVVEIVSPDDPARDLVEKFREYQEGGVRELWLLDQAHEKADFYLLGADGLYHPIAVGEDGVFRSVALEGFWMRVEWLWQEPTPPLLNVLKEWGMV